MSGLSKSRAESLLDEQWRLVMGKLDESVAVVARSSEMYYLNHNDKMPFDLIGRLTTEFILPEDRDGYLRMLEEIFDSGETTTFTYRDVTGQVWRSRMSALRNPQGEVEAALGVGVQIDEKGGDSPLQIRELQMRTAVETTGMGLWSLDLKAKTIALDVRARELHGISDRKDENLTIDEFVDLMSLEYRSNAHGRFTEESLAANESTIEELEYQLSGDGTRWISCRGSVIRNADSVVQCAVGAFFDISDRKLLQEQLLQAQKMEAIGQLTAGIAHNFNNILSAILPNLDLARKHVDSAGSKFVRNAHLAAERASNLINELMVVAGRKEGETRRRLDLYEVVERVVRICQTTFGSWVKLVLEERARASVVANESQIEQVLLNLLLNARDVFESGTTSSPRIHITLDIVREEDQSFALIRVTDNGPGMKESVLCRVFEPFFTTKGKGTGLGLATASAIVREHGGKLQCESSPGETFFDVFIPLAGPQTR